MIKFDRLWALMEEKGLSTYWLREKCGIDSKTLNKLCAALDCGLEEIAEYVKD